MTIAIKHVKEKSQGKFILEENGVKAGHLTYEWNGKDKISIDHTEVDPVHRGKDYGKKLVMAAIEWARAERIKIIPVCPFVKLVFERDKEILDVLYKL